MQMRGDGLRYCSAADVDAAMPDVQARIELAARAMTTLVHDAELPPKIGVHPRSTGSFAHAMPAFVRGAVPEGSADLLGIKWVTGFPENRALGLPSIHASVLLSDPVTGAPRALLDGGPITADRTAAVSGVAISAFLPEADRRGLRVALVGAGVQARSHLAVLGHLLPGARLVVSDRHGERAAAVATEARETGPFADASVETEAVDAIRGADVVVTLVSFGPDRQAIPADAFASARLIVAVDYDMCVPAAIATKASVFAVDDRGQYMANRTGSAFAGYPDPSTTLGEVLLAGTTRPSAVAERGRPTLVTHLGVGVADLVFAAAILAEAERRGLGVLLPR